MDGKYDVVIIGGGPAGLSAAIYAVRKNLKVLVIAQVIGGNAAYAGNIENYLGFTLISGSQLTAKFREDVERFKGDGIEILEGVEVTGLFGSSGQFMVQVSDGREYCGKTVIIASGRIPKMLGVSGEKKFLGKGVAICATCDAPFYKGKDVAVAGGGNSAIDSALTLTKLAKSVAIINNTPNLLADVLLVEKLNLVPGVKIYNNFEVQEISGGQKVSEVRIKDKLTGLEQTLPIDGIFIEVGYDPSTGFDKLTRKDQNGSIVVDESCATSVEGIWAAGDVNNLWGEQIIISAGEGAKAALSVAKYLTNKGLNYEY